MAAVYYLKTMTKTNAFLKPLTPEAELSLGTKLYQIPQFPFMVGRESRKHQKKNYPESRRHPDSIPLNDLYLSDPIKPLNVSREHFQIESREVRFFIIDRGSTCGTLVEGVAIGGEKRGGQHQLFNGDVIIVGTSVSPYIYKFIILGQAPRV
jgi:pSer/pThr/pTyr-binding forkhead associated (FHA) protein